MSEYGPPFSGPVSTGAGGGRVASLPVARKARCIASAPFEVCHGCVGKHLQRLGNQTRPANGSVSSGTQWRKRPISCIGTPSNVPTTRSRRDGRTPTCHFPPSPSPVSLPLPPWCDTVTHAAPTLVSKPSDPPPACVSPTNPPDLATLLRSGMMRFMAGTRMHDGAQTCARCDSSIAPWDPALPQMTRCFSVEV